MPPGRMGCGAYGPSVAAAGLGMPSGAGAGGRGGLGADSCGGCTGCAAAYESDRRMAAVAAANRTTGEVLIGTASEGLGRVMAGVESMKLRVLLPSPRGGEGPGV